MVVDITKSGTRTNREIEELIGIQVGNAIAWMLVSKPQYANLTLQQKLKIVDHAVARAKEELNHYNIELLQEKMKEDKNISGLFSSNSK